MLAARRNKQDSTDSLKFTMSKFALDFLYVYKEKMAEVKLEHIKRQSVGTWRNAAGTSCHMDASGSSIMQLLLDLKDFSSVLLKNVLKIQKIGAAKNVLSST